MALSLSEQEVAGGLSQRVSPLAQVSIVFTLPGGLLILIGS